MAAAEDKRAMDFIKPLKDERMKTHCKRDSSQRVILLYEAPFHIQDGDDCLVTVYEYSGSNTVPDNTHERHAPWSSAWEAGLNAVLVNGDIGYVD